MVRRRGQSRIVPRSAHIQKTRCRRDRIVCASGILEPCSLHVCFRHTKPDRIVVYKKHASDSARRLSFVSVAEAFPSVLRRCSPAMLRVPGFVLRNHNADERKSSAPSSSAPTRSNLLSRAPGFLRRLLCRFSSRKSASK